MKSMIASSGFFNTMRYALIVSLLCYLPYWTTAPWWLLLFIVLTMGYRLISDYYGIGSLAKSIRLLLIIACLVLLKAHYGSIISSNFYIGFLLAFIGLKITEIRTLRDLKVLVLCNFYLIFSALILIQELWIISYLFIAILANLSLMLKLNTPQASLRQIGGKSFKLMLIAIPLSFLLFYIFPRISNPLWQVPSQMHAQIGFSEQMSPGSIAKLFQDDSIAFRVNFKSKPILNGYWRGLILNFYNGVSWRSMGQTSNTFLPLHQLDSNGSVDYEIMLEPHQKKWLFYTNYPVASNPKLLFSPSYGLVSENEHITQRFAYSLQTQTAPDTVLNKNEWAQNTQLPGVLNPKLNAWAKQQYARLNHDPQSFINFLRNYIKQKPFWYTLSPPELASKNQMDLFWFDTQKGFCEHYSSALTIILRSVGIPARVVVGYHGGEWNALAHYLTVQQNSAHAWLEYWQGGVGWQQLDPTSFIAQERIDQTILDQQNERWSQVDYYGSNLTWLQKSRFLLDSARFFAERWFLFYNQETQYNLLQILGLKQWGMEQLLQTAVGFVILFLILMGLLYQWKQKKALDPIVIEYHLLQKEFRRFNVVTHSSATLMQQCQALMTKTPKLIGAITLFLNHYEKIRLQRSMLTSKENNKELLKLLRTFRRTLKQQKPERYSKS